MLYYDYMLTLDREIQFIWPPYNEQGWFTLAFFINRYIPLIGILPIVVSYFIQVNTAVRPSSLLPNVDESENPDRIIAVSYRSV